ncbi:MAG TPA: hypothetical protein VG934_02745 [Candidatus Paceibacterota bacterium]|nr:hypothetical protein [Candidatus Paceibacterota bacterium]
MELTDRQLDEFIALCKRHYKKKLGREEAREAAERLLSFYRLLAAVDAMLPEVAPPPSDPSPSAPAP